MKSAATVVPSSHAALIRKLKAYNDAMKRRLKQACLITAAAIEKDAKQGFGGDYAEDIYRTAIGVGPLPVPPYKDQSQLMPHSRMGRRNGRSTGRVGGLRSTIRKEAVGDFEYEVTAGGAVAPYAGYVEYGTSRARPHPFMFPAAEMNRKEHRRRVSKAISYSGGTP